VTRRELLELGIGTAGALLLPSFLSADGYSKLARLSHSWKSFSLGDRIVAAGREFLGVPYVGWTLEGDPEQCRVYLDKLDCVTFLECAWAVARCAPDVTQERVKRAVTQTRYINGMVDGYWSRLHYTAHYLWFHKVNEKLRIVSDDWSEFAVWAPELSFMSKNPDVYPASRYSSDFVQNARRIGGMVDRLGFRKVPVESWEGVLPRMKPGDFVAFCTSKKGLDFSHVGIYSGRGKFMHASSTAGKVVEQDLVAWGQGVRNCNGMVVSRSAEFPVL
jgi:hypothetical protein